LKSFLSLEHDSKNKQSHNTNTKTLLNKYLLLGLLLRNYE